MTEPHGPDRTADVPFVPADSLDAGLAAGFGRAAPPRSSLEAALRPVVLQEAEGESAHIVQPKSDAMRTPEQAGDRYQLQGEIARGGMGAVLRGRDVDLGRDLAVKVLLENLQAWHRLLEKEPGKARRVVVQQVQHWLDDPDFNGVRGAAALAKLPESERQAWQELWSEVGALRAKASANDRRPEQPTKDK
jgi:hypothetical protein